MAKDYYELLRKTEKKKLEALTKLNNALNGNGGFLVKAEIERNPGMVAWLWLAKDFCEELGDHIEEYVESVGGYDTCEGIELCDIYQTWYNDESGLYELLPVEAQLFTE